MFGLRQPWWDDFKRMRRHPPGAVEHGEHCRDYVTKSGTNQFDGNLYELWNGSTLNAAGYFTSATPGNHKPRSNEVQTKESFLEGLANMSWRSESRSTTRIFAGQHSRVGAIARCYSTWCVRDLQRRYFSPPRDPPFPLPRFSTREPCLHQDILPHGSSSLASSLAIIGFGYSGASAGTWRNKLGHRRFFLPDSCTRSRRMNRLRKFPTCFPASMRFCPRAATCCFFVNAA
jgi:hypothetical protein